MNRRSTDPLVVRHPRTVMPILVERILGRADFDGAAAGKAIVDEVRMLGGTARLTRWRSGWKVSSTTDWFPDVDPLSVFDRPRPLRGDLPHSCYAEVLLIPHCSFVATATPATVHILQQQAGRPFEERSESARTVWFEPLAPGQDR
ncbi:hypothetical protein [Iamia sp.]|uniref:hypothetical protein n=1 Tax=Iamia sp. TaxID=2722710 RepID=UPI002D8079F1|nr:hypothetical protein [Iamia sp.]